MLCAAKGQHLLTETVSATILKPEFNLWVLNFHHRFGVEVFGILSGVPTSLV